MIRHGMSIAAALVVAAVFQTGCGNSDESLDDFDIPVIPSANLGSDDGPGVLSENQPLAAYDSDAPPSLEQGELKFSLAVGDRFPLQKTIEQKLQQQSPSGLVTSTSRLVLMFAITVDQEDEGRRQLSVRYQRVRYSHDILGETLAYDSLGPPHHIPDSLQMYHGLAQNGFSFWIGADNRIIEVENFNEFLKRCVRFAPAERQTELLRRIVATQEDEGFANFVDDSIGLLPYNAAASGSETTVRIGQQWERKKNLTRPLPMEIHTTYELTDLSSELAQIGIVGTINPATTSVTQAQATQQIKLNDGRVIGSCTIDRATGIPLHSRVERQFVMSVEAAGQPPYEQFKTITTTVDAFPTDGTTFSKRTIGPQIPASDILRTEALGVTREGISSADYEREVRQQQQ
jgi:hypothetical protein